MPALATSGLTAYAASSTITASPAEIVRMAYARIVTACDRIGRAAASKPAGWIETFNAESLRAQALLMELRGMLAMDSENADVKALANNLSDLYTFCHDELVAANIAKDGTRCAFVRSTIDGLGSAWEASVCR